MCSSDLSCALTADHNHCATYHADDEDYFSKVYYWTTPTKECLDGRDVECVPYSEWVNAWNKLRA